MRPWVVYIDFAGDNFATLYDVSAKVKHAAIGYGLGGPLDNTARVGTLTLLMKNETRDFSPGNAGSVYGVANLVPMRKVKAYITTGSQKMIFIGFITGYFPTANQFDVRECTITAVDYMGAIQMFKLNMPPQTNRSSEQLAAYIVNQSLNAPPRSSMIQVQQAITSGITVTLTTLSTQVFTFTTTSPATSPNTVLAIANDNLQTMRNLIAAINHTEGLNTAYGPATVPENLFAYIKQNTYYLNLLPSKPMRLYRHNEVAGTITHDTGYNAMNGTLSGGYALGDPSIFGVFDPDAHAIHFDGISAQEVLPTMDLTGSFSALMIVDPEFTMAGGGGFAFSAYISATKQVSFKFTNTGDVSMLIGSTTLTATGAAAAAFAIFHFIYDNVAGKGSIYKNGSLVAGPTTITAYAPAGGWPDCRFGSQAGASFFKGWLDICEFYPRVLTNAEITAQGSGTNQYLQIGFSLVTPGATGTNLVVDTSDHARLNPADLNTGFDVPFGQVSYDTGRATFAFAGTNWGAEKTQALSALQEVVKSENGIFFVARDGTINFHNRDWILKRAAATVVATFGDASDFTVRETIDEVWNAVNVSTRPRTQLSSGVVASLNTAVQIPPWGNSITELLSFVDPTTGQPCSANGLVLPIVATTDFTLNDAKDGTGVGYTTQAKVTFTYKVLGGGIEITATNNAQVPLFITTLKVRGNAVVGYNPTVTPERDAAAIAALGNIQRNLPVDLPLADDPNYATSLARYLLSRWSTPQPRLSAINLGPRDFFPGTNVYVHDVEIGDVLKVSETQTALGNVKVLVWAIQYELDQQDQKTTFTVLVIDDETYWLLGDSTYGALDSTTRLGI